MRIIERFDKYMAFKGLNDNQVTVSCGLSIGLLGRARKGYSDIGKKAIDKILTFYQDLDETWLLTGNGNMLKESMDPKLETESLALTSGDTVTMSREVFELILSQQKTIQMQQERIRQLESKLEKGDAHTDDGAVAAE